MQSDCDFIPLYHTNHSTHDPWHTIFVVLYAIVTTSAFLCNALLLLALKSHQRKQTGNKGITSNGTTAYMTRQGMVVRDRRDRMITVLAGLDICLTISMPLIAVDSLSKFWPFGHETEFLCRFTKSFPSAMIFSTSMMVCVIALSCYWQIVRWYKKQISLQGLCCLTFAIVLLAIFMSSPVFIHTKLMPVANSSTVERTVGDKIYNISEPAFNSDIMNFSLTNCSDILRDVVAKEENRTKSEGREHTTDYWSHVELCAVDWPFYDNFESRVYYSVFCLVVQLVIPSIVISVSYFRVSHCLQNQLHKRQRLARVSQEAIEKENYQTKWRNNMMTAHCMLFLVSWLPLNIAGILMDDHTRSAGVSGESMSITFMSCHLVGMSSTIINPILYGYTQEHIMKGNIAILSTCLYICM